MGTLKTGTAMTNLAEMLIPIVDDIDPVGRSGLEQILEEFATVQTDVVGFEAANKSLPKIRLRAERHTPSVLTKGGREQASENSTIVISAGQLLEMIGKIVDSLQKDAIQRTPADAILQELVSIEGKGHSIDIGLGAHEETLGGHMRF